MGFGIRTMKLSQRKRYFPLPDYNKSEANKVVLEIYGQGIDETTPAFFWNIRTCP